MPDYTKGQIYRITSPSTDKFYIGSTTTPLAVRLYNHRTRFLAGSGSCSSSQIVCYPDHQIELLEEYPCACGADLRRREGWHIRQNKGKVVNKAIAGRTQSEYLSENADIYRKRALEWYYKNKERRHAYNESIREKRLAYQRNYYQTVVKARETGAATVPSAEESRTVAAMGGTLNPPGVSVAPLAGV